MQIIQYPHPTLRRPSKPLRRVDAELHRIVAQMFELMYANNGCGLAANQVDLPYRLFVMNPTGEAAQADQQFVFINPVLSRAKGSAEKEEGCLSLPGLYAPVRRSDKVNVRGYNLQGEELNFTAEGFFARVVQHETDHLDGVLFIDRLSPTGKMTVREKVEEFETEFRQRRESGEIPDDNAILTRLEQLERERT